MLRRMILLTAFVLLCASPVWGQDDYPRGEVFAGYSYFNADLVVQRKGGHGFEVSGAGNFHRNVGVEVDFSGHYKDILGVNVSNYLLLGGPRFTARYERATPFVHALFGLAHTRALGQSSNNFAMALGGGVDINVSPHVAIRAVQADYVLIRASGAGASENLHNARISAGIVFKWGGS
jgi:opacity protein-like surface antigen